MADSIRMANGLYLSVHDADQCVGSACCVHNPSPHPLSTAPLNWRADRRQMERICDHGIGHPDLDHLDFVQRKSGDQAAATDSVHGCDGCCTRFVEGRCGACWGSLERSPSEYWCSDLCQRALQAGEITVKDRAQLRDAHEYRLQTRGGWWAA